MIMAESYNIKERALALANKTDSNSISPKEVGTLMYDMASFAEGVSRNGGTLGIRQVYSSVAEMEADTKLVDIWGNPLKKGNLVVIYDGTTEGVDNNKIYAFLDPGWKLSTELPAGYATKEEVTELGSEVDLLRFSVKTLSGQIWDKNGELKNSSAYKRTNKICVIPSHKYKVYCNIYIAVFFKNNSVLSAIESSTPFDEIETPQDCTHIALTVDIESPESVPFVDVTAFEQNSDNISKYRFSIGVYENKYWRTNGELINGTAYKATKLVYVKSDTTYSVNVEPRLVVQFDINGNFVSAIQSFKNNQFKTSPNVAMVGIDVDNLNEIKFVNISDCTDKIEIDNNRDKVSEYHYQIECLPDGNYWSSKGEIANGTAFRGVKTFNAKPNTTYIVDKMALAALHGVDSSVTVISGKSLMNSKVRTLNNTVKVSIDIVYDSTINSVFVEEVVPIKDLDTKYEKKLKLLTNGIYYDGNGNEITYAEYLTYRGEIVNASKPAFLGTEQMEVSEGETYYIPDALWYVLYNNGEAVSVLTEMPTDKSVTIPEEVTHIAFDISSEVLGIESIYVRNDTRIKNVENRLNSIENIGNNQWVGKKWYAFGCSISDTGADDNGRTSTGKYPKYLKELSGLVHYNWAWGGSTISNMKLENEATMPTALQRLEKAIEEGGILNADLITLDGAVNDYAAGRPIGELTDQTDENNNDSTLFMALYQFVRRIREVNKNATIVLITDSTGKNYSTGNPTNICEYFHKNKIGLIQQDYWDAMIRYARYIGVRCIDAGGKSGISLHTPQYIIDHIHHSDLGGKQFANAIWEELKDIKPNEI